MNQTTKFKAGDIVTCVDATDVYLIQKGSDYEVTKQDERDTWVLVNGEESGYSNYRFKLKDTSMINTTKFVETKTVTITEAKTVIDHRLIGGQLISVSPYKGSTSSLVEVVLGAEYIDAKGYFFNKKCLLEAIAILTEVAKTMKG